jgi:hypothetical protein
MVRVALITGCRIGREVEMSFHKFFQVKTRFFGFCLVRRQNFVRSRFGNTICKGFGVGKYRSLLNGYKKVSPGLIGGTPLNGFVGWRTTGEDKNKQKYNYLKGT